MRVCGQHEIVSTLQFSCNKVDYLLNSKGNTGDYLDGVVPMVYESLRSLHLIIHMTPEVENFMIYSVSCKLCS
jgi:hypothetical protein